MAVLLDILTSDPFRKRPMMWAGSRDFRDIGFWLRGIEYCQRESFPDEPPELEGFREWLRMKYDGPGNTDWQGVIESVFGGGEEATDKAFECLDEFLKDLNELGINQIIDLHETYEIKRYGRITSSFLKKR